MSLDLIIRPKSNPPVRVLEVDGPRFPGPVQRGEGSYYLSTDNHPICDPYLRCDVALDSRLKDWNSPWWEIYQHNDGSITIHACRPTHQETMRGDLHGRWGSIITIRPHPRKSTLKQGLRLARLLCKCLPLESQALYLSRHWEVFISKIETDIPIYFREEEATLADFKFNVL